MTLSWARFPPEDNGAKPSAIGLEFGADCRAALRHNEPVFEVYMLALVLSHQRSCDRRLVRGERIRPLQRSPDGRGSGVRERRDVGDHRPARGWRIALVDHLSRASDPASPWFEKLVTEAAQREWVLQDQSQIPGFPQTQVTGREVGMPRWVSTNLADAGAETMFFITGAGVMGTPPTLHATRISARCRRC